MARPPGGRVEQPVVNCRNAFLSSDDMPHKTLTKRRKPGLRGRRERSNLQEAAGPDSHLEPDCEDLPVSGIAQLWFGVVNDVISCPGR